MTQLPVHRSHADLALAVYLEPHAERRRVLLLGDADGPLAEKLLDTAESVEIIDPGTRGPSHGEVPELPFEDGRFDLVVVADVSALPEPRADAVRELRRVLSDDGFMVLCASGQGRRRKRGGAPQDLLDRLLGNAFRFVRVLGQAPLSGYSLGQLDAARDDEFSVDSSLVRGQRERIERFVGFGCDERLRLEARLWVQVPAAEVAEEDVPAADRPDPQLVQSLRRAEDDAREALRREADLLRELEAARRGREQAERLAERAKLLERKLTAAEGDYDDAVARVRFLESEIAEREGHADHERSLREKAERELAQARQAMGDAEAKRAHAEQERESLRAELAEAAAECTALEQRLVEAGEQARTLAQDKKHHESVARDLLEELRRREQVEHTAVEHDARVAELDAERERAVQRALEAELARESALMRADELRAQLHAESARVAPSPAAAEQAGLRGELSGLRLRLREAEAALSARPLAAVPAASAPAAVEDSRLDRALDRIDELEAALERTSRRAAEADRVVELEAELDSMEHRVRGLSRELDEADRFAEAHAEDAERVDALETELEAARTRLDSQEDELRATQDELRGAKADAANVAVEASARVELAQRREHEARVERDDARAALAEARSILAQLAGRVGAEAENPASIVEALAQGRPHDELTELRAALSERETRLVELARDVEARDERIRQLEQNLKAQIRGSVPPPPFGSSDNPDRDHEQS